MAKRELSSTLKNLKFMHRAALREGKDKKEEESKADGNFFSSSTQIRKCVVISEGNPPPGAVKGRMSFLSFNPSIDKLNEAAKNLHQPQVSAMSSPNEKCPDRESGSSKTESEGFFSSRTNSVSDGDNKRKQPENGSDTAHPNKSLRNKHEGSSPNSSNGSYQKQQREKLDWKLLRPPKSQNRS